MTLDFAHRNKNESETRSKKLPYWVETITKHTKSNSIRLSVFSQTLREELQSGAIFFEAFQGKISIEAISSRWLQVARCVQEEDLDETC